MFAYLVVSLIFFVWVVDVLAVDVVDKEMSANLRATNINVKYSEETLIIFTLKLYINNRFFNIIK